MNGCELLAPAKDKTCAFAAIDFGADAIYIAAEKFGARKAAGNSIEDIKEVVNYAHKFGVKVYVTLNTILTDDELNEAKNLIKELENIHVDAVIIQDFGLLNLDCKIPFHASTQCDIETVEKVKFLEDIGFERVVLARELSLEQIREIKEKTNVELEVFIHGALCVSYSGQCYLSRAIGSRSANRGDCAQPCRKKYSLIDDEGNVIAKDKPLLALKDFNASKYLKELVEANVTSFKIEGRLKDVNYVKNVVAFYRKKLDELNVRRTSFGKSYFDFEPDLNKSFNRGFSEHFLNGRKNSFGGVNSRGEYLGKVEDIGKNFFVIKKNNENISSGDGLWFDIDAGCLVNKVVGDKIYPNKMPKIHLGTNVYRSYNFEFEKKLKHSQTTRKLSAKIDVLKEKIIATDEMGNCAELTYDFEPAKNEQSMKEKILSCLKKSGDSIYKAEEVNIKTQIPFLPVSKLNAIRKDLYKQLEKREFKYSKRKVFKPVNLGKTLDYRANIMNSEAEKFYKDCNCKIKEWALTDYKDRCVMRTKHCLKYAFNLCGKDKKLYLVDEKGKKYNLKFDCKNCQMQIFF